ncbi:unnamed protein product [Spirodela intermedia]|uniref:Uncharacterized protein n=1 Tax=Spirodela intermedia TaxID=51605 RepID=A0A7I8IDP6_SPIIN|nr:unnamed protein product [Spirodela intermedia]CAA6655162.1 unnamed protein product [Spirodela intermedia]
MGGPPAVAWSARVPLPREGGGHAETARAASPAADRLPAVPHPAGAHRRPPSASLPTISSTL